MSIVQLNDLCDDLIEKIPVMGNDENSTAVVQEISLQPCDGGHVQMVRRLIEKNDIRVCEKKLAQGNSCLLSAGECGDLLGELLLRKAKSL